tara:strand:+ start:294 stop:1223 length:930 start_codon:yes stop_codon:yes gene_type:complete
MDLIKTLQTRGIAVFENIFKEDEIKFLRENFIKNCDYATQGDDRRYGGKGGTVKCKYLELKGIYELGLLEKIINPNFKELIKTIMPDGQVWRFYYIQSPPNQSRPHFIPKGGGIGDFHYDRKNPVYKDERIDFVDFSIYLNDVGEHDGNYAFYPSSPTKKPLGFEKIINVYGKAGTVIVSRVDWFHSATPNINQNPRHLLRVALCKNFFDIDDYYDERKTISKYYKDKDEFLSFIFGSDRRWYKEVKLNGSEVNSTLKFTSPKTNGRINFSLKGKTTDANKEWNPREIIENSLIQVIKNFIKRLLNKHN